MEQKLLLDNIPDGAIIYSLEKSDEFEADAPANVSNGEK